MRFQPVHDIDVHIEERLLEPRIQLPAYTMFTENESGTWRQPVDEVIEFSTRNQQ